MRPLEIALVVVTASSALCLWIRPSGKAGQWLSAAALALLAAHAFLEGVHWQMIPAYAGLIAVCLLALNTLRSADGKANRKRRLLRAVAACSAILLAIAATVFSYVLPIFRLPKPTGPYAVGTSTLYFEDRSRVEDAAPSPGGPRRVAVQLWYPAGPGSHRLARYRELRETRFLNSYQSVVLTDSYRDAPLASAPAPFSVVLFDPGWKGRRTQNTALTEELASYGYVVAAIDHPYNAGLVAFPDGQVIRSNASIDIAYPNGSSAERVRAIWDKELLKWSADESFVLDRLEALNRTAGSPWQGRLDAERVVAVGHSFGGAASVEACARDRRIRAAVNLDGWLFGAIRARGPNQPLMVIGEADQTPPGAPLDPHPAVDVMLDRIDGAELEASLRRYGGYFIHVRGAQHMDFTDQPLLSPLASVAERGSVSGLRMQQIVRAYVLAFVNRNLRGEDAEILRGPGSPFSEASLTVYPVPANSSASSAAAGRPR